MCACQSYEFGWCINTLIRANTSTQHDGAKYGFFTLPLPRVYNNKSVQLMFNRKPFQMHIYIGCGNTVVYSTMGLYLSVKLWLPTEFTQPMYTWASLVPRPSPNLVSWLHTWPLNHQRSGRRPCISSMSSNRSIMMYVDLVLVIMATCSRVK